MEELRLTFLIFGALAIAGILAHGLWTVRKKRSAEHEPPEPEHLHYRDTRSDADFEISDDKSEQDFDDLGIGPVRVVKVAPQKTDTDGANVSAMDDSPASGRYSEDPEPPTFNETRATQSSFTASSEEERLNDGPQSVPEPPSFLLRTGDDEQVRSVPTRKEPVISDIADCAPDTIKDQPHEHGADTQTQTSHFGQSKSDKAVSPPASSVQARHTDEAAPAEQSPASGGTFAQQARKLVQRKKPDITKASPKRKEPKIDGARLAEDQMRIDFDEPELKADTDMRSESQAEKPKETKPASQEVLVLNVKAPEGKPVPGSVLLPSLLTLGFKFGEQDIFHRHVNSNGKGPVLFSLANMFKPGVFDIDNMETFTTQGVSLFMILPIEGDPHQVFNMMHNAARKLADEFGAQVLDGRRSVLTKQSLQQYVEKIREFERQRMIKRAN
ncbi:cell division protein ZipA [Lacimicrobium alkaliphilum]|uniref:Cell division protein ZipA n=1 Tax=Lacimicrobium alkaliphilum TaxID=1526571 RepID=A0ABQ1R4I0_9ALTE|nr:cell division protein ZipA [Lacimicrobium alkaliphilum]GGD54383.1 cell division protein ZipA [Lacimicrobium alkaliphilum]